LKLHCPCLLQPDRPLHIEYLLYPTFYADNSFAKNRTIHLLPTGFALIIITVVLTDYTENSFEGFTT
jgi:hypothetical protein